jgi:tripartite-type tricarboxylate transporter receptor subunit TctC
VSLRGNTVKLPRRQFLHLAAGGAALPVVSRIAGAQAYPSRPVRIVIGLPAGSSPDIVARLVGQALAERFGQQVIIENRPGASSNIGTEVVVRAPPDGYTLLLATGSNAINATLFEKLSFDFARDIAPVASIGRLACVVVVNPSFSAKTVPEFIAYAKANPGKINMASLGSGTTPQLAGELFKIRTGVEWITVQYRAISYPI